MDMREACRIFAGHRGGAAAMVSSGQTPTMWEVAHEDPTLYFTGMSYRAAGALGLALTRPDLKVVAIEGDGSMLMGLANLPTIGRYAPTNLVVLVMDNRTYLGSFKGHLDSASVTTDFAAVAAATNFRLTITAETSEELDLAIGQAMAESGPSMVVARVDKTRVLDAAKQRTRPDRTEFTIAFQRWLADHPGPKDVPLPSAPVDRSAETRGGDAQQFGRTAGGHIYRALKAAGIDFIVYLPDGELYSVIEEAEADPEMAAVCCNREDEGIAIAGGAAAAGRRVAVVMEGTGIGFSGLILAHEILNRVPMVILSSHSKEMGIRLPHNDVAAMVNEPVLDALGIHKVVLRHLADAELYIAESQRSAEVLKQPVAIVIPPHVMAEAALSG